MTHLQVLHPVLTFGPVCLRFPFVEFGAAIAMEWLKVPRGTVVESREVRGSIENDWGNIRWKLNMQVSWDGLCGS